MARPPDDDINNSIINNTTFTTNPEATNKQQSPTPHTTAMSSLIQQLQLQQQHPQPPHQPPQTPETDHQSDPPPPLPANLDDPTPAEDLALQTWVGRNRAYITTIPWHRYPCLPVLSYIWGYNDADFRHECLSSLMFYTRCAGRRLTPQERDALLEPVTRMAVAASYDRPVAAGLGAYFVARSWAKSGAREAFRRAAEEAARKAAASAASSASTSAGAAGLGMGLGAVGADGHITHFSAPQQHHQYQIPQGTSTAGRLGQGGRMLGSLLKRTARASVPALLCFAGYEVLQDSYRLYLGGNEIDSIREDIRLEEMVVQMDRTMASRVDDIEELLRRRG